MTHADTPSYGEMTQAERKAQQDKDIETIKKVAGGIGHDCDLPTNNLDLMEFWECPQCHQRWHIVYENDQWKANKWTGEFPKAVLIKAPDMPPRAFGDPTRTAGEKPSVAPPKGSGISNDEAAETTLRSMGYKPVMSGLEGGKVEQKPVTFTVEGSFSEVGQDYELPPSAVMEVGPGVGGGNMFDADHGGNEYDAVEPPHYKRGPKIKVDITSVVSRGMHFVERTVQCIEVMRHIRDPRLATAFKYLWRVAFGGKREPGETRSQAEIDKRDLESAIWYIRDYLDNPVQ